MSDNAENIMTLDDVIQHLSETGQEEILEEIYGILNNDFGEKLEEKTQNDAYNRAMRGIQKNDNSR